MKEPKMMQARLSGAAAVLVLGMFALAGCSTTPSTATSNDASSAPAASNSSDSNSPTTPTSSYTKEDVEKACAGSCHSVPTVDAWNAVGVDASTAKSMVPSLSDDQAAAITAFYTSK